MLGDAGRAGHIATGEVEMIDRIFELDDLLAREVMVPRPDVITLTSEQPLAAIRELVAEADHTRYPVLDAEDQEQIVGFLDVKDVVRADQEGRTDATAGELSRPINVAPETTPVIELLEEMQASRRQMAAVIDEWGGFAGLVTIEDIVESVVGDIQDQFDAEEPAIAAVGPGRYHVDAAVTIDQLNDNLDATLESSLVTTVGGFVLDRLGRVPEPGDTVAVDGYTLEVLAVDGRRIETLEIRRDAEE